MTPENRDTIATKGKIIKIILDASDNHIPVFIVPNVIIFNLMSKHKTSL